jgi:hypothetical protein
MLVNKFKRKYGPDPDAASVINQEVGKFMKNDRLTEENLRKLDTRIGRETELRLKKKEILDDKKNNRPLTAASSKRSHVSGRLDNQNDDLGSVRSYASSRMSGATNLSKQTGKGKQ